MREFKDTIHEKVNAVKGIELEFKDKSGDIKAGLGLLQSYDTQIWAIDSQVQYKKAETKNENILSSLSKLGKGEIKYKSGMSNTEKIVKF